jgi:hypothetical protein
MSLILSGTDGLSDVDGTAAAPAIRGTDTNTGIFFPAADTIAFAEGGAEVARFDSAGNLGVGTSSPDCRLMLQTPSGTACQLNLAQSAVTNYRISIPASTDALAFVYGASTERMRIDSSGNLLVGGTTAGAKVRIETNLAPQQGLDIKNTTNNTGNSFVAFFNYNNVVAGSITQPTATTVAYNTSSDYRLKEAIVPMTGALAKVALLKPCTYKWKEEFGGTNGQGFIAHELQAVVPECVSGAKDAVETYMDEDGVEQTRPKYQGIDTSFLVATLAAAIQEQQAIITALTTRITALEAANV